MGNRQLDSAKREILSAPASHRVYLGPLGSRKERQLIRCYDHSPRPLRNRHRIAKMIRMRMTDQNKVALNIFRFGRCLWVPG